MQYTKPEVIKLGDISLIKGVGLLLLDGSSQSFED